jgi:hypothetical protein
LPIVLSDLAQVYNGSARPALATVSVPFGYTVDVAMTYNGSPTPPTNVGTYDVIASIDHPQFTGSATGELVISKAPASTRILGTLQAYDGTPRVVELAVNPSDVPVSITYQLLMDGAPVGVPTSQAPTAVGKYAITATSPNHTLNPNTGDLTVTKRGVSISLSGLSVAIDGQPKPVTVRTVPANIPVTVTYSANGNSSTNPPSAPPPGGGDWLVTATVTDQTSDTGSATAPLKMISRVPAPITLTGPATCTPYNKPSYTARVTPIRPGVRPSGTVSFKHNGQEIFRANPGTDGVCVLPNHYIKVSPTPYAVFAEYSGDENYLPNTSAPVQTVSQRHVIFSGFYSLFQIYDGKPVEIEPWMLYYLDRNPYTSYTTTFNGSSILPTNVTTSPLTLINVIQIPADDIEVHEWTSLNILKGYASIKLGKLRQSFRDGENFPVEVITDPPGIPVTVSYNGSVVPQGPDYPGTFNVRAWISDPNYEPAEVTGQLVVTRAAAQFTVSNLTHEYDGRAKGVSVQVRPAIPYSVTYNGSNQLPTAPGIYRVEVVPYDQGSFGPGNSYNMTINARVSATATDGQTSGIGSLTLSGIANGSTSVFPALVSPGSNAMSLRFNNTTSPTEKITFLRWSDGSTQNPRSLSFGGAADPAKYNYVAQVKREIYLKPTQTGTGEALGGGYYKVGDLAQFEAWAPRGQVVDRWSYDGVTLSPANNSMHRVLRSGREVYVKVKAGAAAPVAHFVPGYIAETFANRSSGKGTVTFTRKNRDDMEPVSQGGVPHGVNFVATATAKDGFAFHRWVGLSGSAYVNPNPLTNFSQNPAEFRHTSGEYAQVFAEFIKNGPELNVEVVEFDRGRVGYEIPHYLRTKIKVTNAGKGAVNTRLRSVEATGYRIRYNGEQAFRYYYPNPTAEEETANTTAPLMTQAQKNQFVNLTPFPIVMSALNLSFGDIGTNANATRPLDFFWFDDINFGLLWSTEEVRLTFTFTTDNGGTIKADTWVDFAQ